MTILFSASRLGNKELYKDMIRHVESLGHTVLSGNLFNYRELIDKQSDIDIVKTFKRNLDRADLMIADLTMSSSSLGIEFATAIERKKPVLGLFGNSINELSIFLKQNKSRYLIIKEYSPENFQTVLDQSIKEISKKLNYVLYVELSNEYGGKIERLRKAAKKTKKQVIEDAIDVYTQHTLGKNNKL